MSGPLLIFGAHGQVGRDLVGLAARRGARPVGVTHAEGDITDAKAVAAIVTATAPRLIVNAAAYTAVDRAESEPNQAHAVNVEGPRILAAAAAAAGVPLLHLSTDYVFDGTKRGAYGESDALAPLGVYGTTKAAGEAAVRAAGPRHVILRTSWVYGVHGANFLKTMLRLAAERDRLRVVADQRGCPTATLDLAEAILCVDATLAAHVPGSRTTSPFGTFHFAGTGATSWHAFAEAIVAVQAEWTGKHPPVDPIGTEDYPTPARRPANSELSSMLFAQTFGYRAAPWPIRVRGTIAQLFAGVATRTGDTP